MASRLNRMLHHPSRARMCIFHLHRVRETSMLGTLYWRLPDRMETAADACALRAFLRHWKLRETASLCNPQVALAALAAVARLEAFD